MEEQAELLLMQTHSFGIAMVSGLTLRQRFADAQARRARSRIELLRLKTSYNGPRRTTSSLKVRLRAVSRQELGINYQPMRKTTDL